MVSWGGEDLAVPDPNHDVVVDAITRGGGKGSSVAGTSSMDCNPLDKRKSYLDPQARIFGEVLSRSSYALIPPRKFLKRREN